MAYRLSHIPSYLSFHYSVSLLSFVPSGLYTSRRLSPFSLIILSIVLISFLCITSDRALIYLDQACSSLSILHLISYTIVVLPSSSPVPPYRTHVIVPDFGICTIHGFVLLTFLVYYLCTFPWVSACFHIHIPLSQPQ